MSSCSASAPGNSSRCARRRARKASSSDIGSIVGAYECSSSRFFFSSRFSFPETQCFIHGDTFSISLLHLAIKVQYFSNSGHKNEKVTSYLESLDGIIAGLTLHAAALKANATVIFKHEHKLVIESIISGRAPYPFHEQVRQRIYIWGERMIHSITVFVFVVARVGARIGELFVHIAPTVHGSFLQKPNQRWRGSTVGVGTQAAAVCRSVVPTVPTRRWRTHLARLKRQRLPLLLLLSRTAVLLVSLLRACCLPLLLLCTRLRLIGSNWE
eukprot:SAG31_NODE_5035_length_2787_cov_2.005952_3_plen_270_part_00